MFSFAKNFVKTIEKSAESIITTSSNLINTENDPYFQTAGGSYGFRVLYIDKVNPKISELKLEPWFDYIVGINNHELLTQPNSPVPDYNLFIQEIANCVGKSLILSVWNAKGGICRQVIVDPVTPFENPENVVYNAEGLLVGEKNVVTNNKFATLGFTVQATPLATATFVYHVIDVQANSPAEQCGLIPHSDYVIGAEDGLFATGGEDLFGRVINSIYSRNPGQCEMQLYVYNHDFDLVRPVTIHPRDGWGGRGILGCGVGYGYLHRLPQVVGKFDNDSSVQYHLQPPGQTLFNLSGDDMSSKEFVPAAIANSTPSPVKPQTAPAIAPITPTPATGPPLSAPPRRKKKHVGIPTDFSDYFRQETEKSEKLDVRTTKVGGDLPAPPKLTKKEENPQAEEQVQ